MKKIFINIASYRDPTLVETIKNALETAKHPDRLVFALGLEYYDYEMPDLSFLNDDQIKIIRYKVNDGRGLVRIRYEISKLLTDEEYFLMIDSHTSFSEFWDEQLIKQYEEMIIKNNNNKIVFSIIKEDRLVARDYIFPFRYSYDFGIEHRIIEERCDLNDEVNFVVCSMLFTNKDFLTEVGFDQNSGFIWEEPYLYWRIFMSNWKVYTPKNVAILQDWNKREKYVDYAYTEKNFDNRFDSHDTQFDRTEMFVSMLTNLPGRYSIKNSVRTTEEFFDKNNIKFGFENLENIKQDIFKANEILHKDKNYPISKELIDFLLLLSRFIPGYRL